VQLCGMMKWILKQQKRYLEPYNIGYIMTGEWFAYMVNVTLIDVCKINIRLMASKNRYVELCEVVPVSVLSLVLIPRSLFRGSSLR